jgi:2-polyprenyl-3-methyl-5-hydroxy-6-metoxy-1,4-benzoquinol methylase
VTTVGEAGEQTEKRLDTASARRRVRTAVIREALETALKWRAEQVGVAELGVLDVGGGTGGFAVPLAELGHRVTVLEPSPDALAALHRRATDAGVQDRIRSVQDDAGELAAVFAAESFDAVLCHGVLEHVEEPAAVLSAAATVLRPGGLASVVAANRHAAVLARAVAGHLDQARAALADPAGRWGDRDPLPRRFAPEELPAMFAAAGLSITAVHGIRVCADLVPSALVDGDPVRTAELLELESQLAIRPEYLVVAAALHVLATRR